MKLKYLKYYLRGLGIGIVVTALIMGIALKDRRPLTDAEIKAAAMKLGMVESDSLKLTDLPQTGAPGGTPEPAPNATPEPAPDAMPGETPEPTATPEPASDTTPEPASDTTPEPTPDTTPEPTPDTTPTAKPTPTPTAKPTPDTTSTAKPTPVPTPDTTAEPLPEGASGGNDTITITIRRGTGSGAVCSQLAAEGLIADAAAFDRYLIEGGYSTRIGAGTFEIPMGASEEEIAKIISRSR